jgi:competence protein ComEC
VEHVTRLSQTLARHPLHLGLGAFVTGLPLAARPGLAVIAGGCGGLGLLAAIGYRRPLVCVAVALLLPAGTALGAARIAAIDHSDLAPLAGRDVSVRGFVTKRERPSFGVRRLRLRVNRVEAGVRGRRAVHDLAQLRVPGEVRLALPSIGDELVATGTLSLPKRSTGGSFDYRAYLRRAGVHVVLRARFAEATGRRRTGLAGAIDAIRSRAEAGVSAGLSPPLAALARGMVLGEDEDISDRTSEDFKRSGLAHVLAVSGQNVTLLAVLAWPLLAALGLGRRGRLAGVLALIALYVPLTGAGPSIVRAGAMGAAGTVAALAGRPASRWYSVLLALAVTLSLDPRAWQDVGWQLSFAAVVGIFLFVPGLMRALAFLPEPLAGGASMTIAATVATAPLMSFHFGRVSLVSLPANVVALPAVAPVMWIGMLASAAAQVSLAPAQLLNALDAYLLGFVTSVAHWSAGLPGGVWALELRTARALVAAYALIGAAVAAIAVRRGRRMLVIAALLIAASATALAQERIPPAPSRFTATFLDVGQGDATLFQAPGAGILVDGGPPEANVVAMLRAHGVRRLDVVVLTHAQRDHEGGLEAVVRSLPVGLLLDGGAYSRDPEHARIAAAARARGIRVAVPAAGQAFGLGRLQVHVLSPPAGPPPDPAEDPNLRAIVLTVSYGDLDFFLPADAESDVTGGLPLPPVEVLKVAHHGSEDEDLPALLDRLRPRVAVIEVGEGNRYGHPAAPTLAELARARAGVYRTDRDGEVTVTAGPTGPLVRARSGGSPGP